ncbi:class I SAM-dependent methyltransferase [Actinoplanes sp. NPDC026670]|uniref:class I SAM-dependent methyltransferase n=1 Tax=Actinoplanes sp. NPDC026670 TaxID=3154700 RepID=UPI0034038161
MRFSQPDIGGRWALDVGAGTGRATEMFAREGLPVVALEPDDAMAEVLARRVTRFPDVQVVRGSFEEFRPTRRFGLLFSAEAWHWTVPETRWSLAADALADGATLALFWNTERISTPALRTSMLQTFAEHAPSVVINDEPVTAEQVWHRWPGDELSGITAFENLTSRHYQRRWNMPKADYLDLARTRSQFRMLPPPVREELLAAWATLFTDEVPIMIHTTLLLARRRPPAHQ